MTDDTVNRDALRAELALLELRLVEKLATQTEVGVIRKDVDSLKSWRAYTAGVAATAMAVGSAALAFAAHLFG